jgi:hypothetical protein
LEVVAITTSRIPAITGDSKPLDSQHTLLLLVNRFFQMLKMMRWFFEMTPWTPG